MKEKPKTKVLVAMSGGVDSSVAALIMKRSGFQVIGAFMKNYSNSPDSNCNWKADRTEAMKVASKLQIPLIILDFEKEYRKLVVDKMFDQYKKGITPNPDVDCNQKIKFPLLRQAAKKLGAEFVVTGHFARIKKIKNSTKSDNDKQQNKFNQRDFTSLKLKDNWKNKSNSTADSELSGINKSTNKGSIKLNNPTHYKLLRARDETKDQSYFLYRLSQEDLKHSLFPIGDYTKAEVREIAKKHGFQNYDRKSTVGICFIGKVNMKKFLQKKIKPKKGKILNPEGELVGFHDGIYYYTIGQRLGSKEGIEFNKTSNNKKQLLRWYVASKNPKKNEIVAAPEGHKLLYRKEIILKNPHWINQKEVEDLFSKEKINDKVKSSKSNDEPHILPVNIRSKFANGSEQQIDNSSWVGGGETPQEIKVKARIRQLGELSPATLKKEKGKLKIILNKPTLGVSEGQAIVLYKGAVCLGGGVIGFE